MDQGGVVDRTCNPYVSRNSKTNEQKCGHTVKAGCRKYNMGKDKNVYRVKPTVQDIKVSTCIVMSYIVMAYRVTLTVQDIKVSTR